MDWSTIFKLWVAFGGFMLIFWISTLAVIVFQDWRQDRKKAKQQQESIPRDWE